MDKNKKYREWKEFLKKDEDYDWSYIIRTLSYKLKRTRQLINKNKITEDYKKTCKEIRDVEIVLNRIEKDNYLSLEIKEFEKKYGKVKLKFVDTKDGYYSTVVDWSKIPKEKLGPAKRVHKTLFRKADKKMQGDIDKAFSLMAKNIRKWWD